MFVILVLMCILSGAVLLLFPWEVNGCMSWRCHVIIVIAIASAVTMVFDSMRGGGSVISNSHILLLVPENKTFFHWPFGLQLLNTKHSAQLVSGVRDNIISIKVEVLEGHVLEQSVHISNEVIELDKPKH